MDAPATPRERLLEAVALMPGASTRALADETSISETTAGYHLHKLAKEGRITTQVVGRDRVWYRASCRFCPVLRRAIPVLRRPGALSLARSLSDTPATIPTLAARADVEVGAARWMAAELADALLAERTQRGRLALRQGAEVCIQAALGGEGCALWGSCAMSRAWRERLGGGDELAQSVK